MSCSAPGLLYMEGHPHYGSKGCPQGFRVPWGGGWMLAVGLWGLVPPALVPQGIWRRAGCWQQGKGFPSW